jgi:predicted DNA-binding transcriptional regulator AlpA
MVQKRKPRVSRGPRAGTVVIWAKGVEERYGISPPTRWRWERKGLLPARDVHIGGRSGWRPETLAAAESRAARKH